MDGLAEYSVVTIVNQKERGRLIKARKKEVDAVDLKSTAEKFDFRRELRGSQPSSYPFEFSFLIGSN